MNSLRTLKRTRHVRHARDASKQTTIDGIYPAPLRMHYRSTAGATGGANPIGRGQDGGRRLEEVKLEHATSEEVKARTARFKDMTPDDRMNILLHMSDSMNEQMEKMVDNKIDEINCCLDTQSVLIDKMNAKIFAVADKQDAIMADLAAETVDLDEEVKMEDLDPPGSCESTGSFGHPHRIDSPIGHLARRVLQFM